MAEMEYVALRRIKIGPNDVRLPGDPVPEAKGWKNLPTYLSNGYIAATPVAGGTAPVRPPTPAPAAETAAEGAQPDPAPVQEAAIQQAIGGLDPDDAELWTRGKPKVAAVDAALGGKVSRAEVDAAWAAMEPAE